MLKATAAVEAFGDGHFFCEEVAPFEGSVGASASSASSVEEAFRTTELVKASNANKTLSQLAEFFRPLNLTSQFRQRGKLSRVNTSLSPCAHCLISVRSRVSEYDSTSVHSRQRPSVHPVSSHGGGGLLPHPGRLVDTQVAPSHGSPADHSRPLQASHIPVLTSE